MTWTRPTDPECVFCKIVARTIPAEVVLDVGEYVAVRDVNPQAPVHVVLISRSHAERHEKLPWLGSDVVRYEFLSVVAMVARAAGLADYRLVMNCGPGAGQTVMHTHAHILGGWETAPPIVGDAT